MSEGEKQKLLTVDWPCYDCEPGLRQSKPEPQWWRGWV